MPRLPATRTARASTQRRGFTLVELMVSITLLALIVGLLTSVFNTTTRAWTATEGGNERRRSDRALTDFIGAELRGAMLPVTMSSPANMPNLQMLINPPSSMVPQDFQNPHSIFWQAPLATERTLGDVAEIGYFVKWDATPGVSPSLCRFFINPSVRSGTSHQPVANSRFQIYSQMQWLSRPLLDEAVALTAREGYRGLFGENVLGFWVRFYGLGNREVLKKPPSQALATTFDSRIGYTYQTKKDPLSLTGQDKAEQRYLPLSVSISIAQLDSRTAKKLENCWSTVRDLVRRSDLRDASDFLRTVRVASDKDPSLRPILPGLQIYETDVLLDNGR